MGSGTARVAEQVFGQTPDFTGDGVPENTAKAFLAVARGQRVVFPSAKDSLHSLQQYFEGSIECCVLPAYHNVPLSCPPDLSDFDVLVFTSPMNVRAYFSKFPVLPGQALIAIGATTAAALRKTGAQLVSIAPTPDEADLAKAVLAN